MNHINNSNHFQMWQLNCLHFLLLSGALLTLLSCHFPCAHARAMSTTSAASGSTNSNSSQELELKLEITTEQVQQSQNQNQTAVTTNLIDPSIQQALVVKHIVRQKREIEPTLPFSFFTLHWPCMFDLRYTHLMQHLKNPCVWIYYNRFVHEGYYRVYKTYQIESFFFGQYAMRIYRVELNPGIWIDEPLK